MSDGATEMMREQMQEKQLCENQVGAEWPNMHGDFSLYHNTVPPRERLVCELISRAPGLLAGAQTYEQELASWELSIRLLELTKES